MILVYRGIEKMEVKIFLSFLIKELKRSSVLVEDYVKSLFRDMDTCVLFKKIYHNTRCFF